MEGSHLISRFDILLHDHLQHPSIIWKGIVLTIYIRIISRGRESFTTLDRVMCGLVVINDIITSATTVLSLIAIRFTMGRYISEVDINLSYSVVIAGFM